MSRRGVYRGIYCALVDDPDFQALTPHARLALLALRICPQAGAAAIFRFYPAVLREQTGLGSEDLEHALEELARLPRPEAPWIYRDGPIVWIRNGLRFDPYLRLADAKHRKSVEKAVSGLPRLAIVLSFCDYYEIARPFDDPGKTLVRPLDDPALPSTEFRDTEIPSTECRASGSRETLNGTHAPSRLPREVQL